MYSIYGAFAEISSIVLLFMLGASLGSFLNVVAYRLPRGKTLLGGSFCPHCRQPILFRHNVPIFGWLMLRGRCRVCRLPISKRYPLVELLMGTLFLAIAVPELALGGINFPGLQPPRYWGFAWNFLDMEPNFLVLFAGHACLVTCLFACTLIEWDRRPIPLSLIIFLLAGALIVARTDPQLVDGHMTRLAAWGSSWSPADLQLRLFGALLGALGGNLVGRCDLPDRRRRPDAWEATVLWAIAGWWLGGLATMSLFVIGGLLILGRFTIRGSAGPVYRLLTGPAGLLLVAVVLQLLLWSLFAKLPGWPVSFDRFPATFVWLALAMAVFVGPPLGLVRAPTG